MVPLRLIRVQEDIHADNALLAARLRERLSRQGTFLLNLMSAPGAGKTSVILRTIETLRNRLRIGVIEADIESTVDAERLAACGIPAVQLNTGGFCHLDATMVSRGLEALDLGTLDAVIVENVGNLVCPAEFDTGAIRNAMILSVPEGDDKPLKYPLMFTVCDALLVNKIDYLELSDFDLPSMRERVLHLNPRIEIFPVSARTGEGFAAWTEWFVREVGRFRGQGIGDWGEDK